MSVSVSMPVRPKTPSLFRDMRCLPQFHNLRQTKMMHRFVFVFHFDFDFDLWHAHFNCQKYKNSVMLLAVIGGVQHFRLIVGRSAHRSPQRQRLCGVWVMCGQIVVDFRFELEIAFSKWDSTPRTLIVFWNLSFDLVSLRFSATNRSWVCVCVSHICDTPFAQSGTFAQLQLAKNSQASPYVMLQIHFNKG